MKLVGNIFALFILFSISFIGFGQRMTKLNTNGNGTFFGQVSYNRSFYSKAKVHFEENGASFDLLKTPLSDNSQGKGFGGFFTSPSPQFSAKLGYFITNYWAITVSWDQYNSFFKEGNTVELNGNFPQASHSTYFGQITDNVSLNGTNHALSQRKGMNFIALGVQRNDMLFKSRGAEFGIQVLYGVKIGGIHTIVTSSYDGATRKDISSFGGFGISAEVGLRFEFFQHVFLQLSADGGYLHQGKIKTSNTVTTNFAKQSVSFISPKLSLGFSIFANSKNNCTSCPKW